MQNAEATLSTYGYKAIKLTADNKMTSQGNFPKSTDTGVNSLTPVAENYPRVEALTSLSGLMCIVSSNPDNRFPQKFNEKNSPSREVISFKSGQIRHTVHLFVEKFEK